MLFKHTIASAEFYGKSRILYIQLNRLKSSNVEISKASNVLAA